VRPPRVHELLKQRGHPRVQLGLLPDDRLSVISPERATVSMRVRWSPFEAAIQAGDVLDPWAVAAS
jgi:hypothetical protein